MVKRVHKGSDGYYHVAGGKFKVLIGSRAQVMHGTAYKTSGELTKDELTWSKTGRIVSKVKHETAKKEKRLEKYGYFAKKGKFGYVKKRGTKRRSKKRRNKSKRNRSN